MTSSYGNIFQVTNLMWGNPPVTSGFPSKRPATRSFDVSLICAWTNGWAYNRDVGELIRHHDYYDAIMISCIFSKETHDVYFKKQTLSQNHFPLSLLEFPTKRLLPKYAKVLLQNSFLYFLHRETVQLSQETYLFYNRMQRFLPHERVMKWKRVPHYWTFVRSPMDSLTKVQ